MTEFKLRIAGVDHTEDLGIEIAEAAKSRTSSELDHLIHMEKDMLLLKAVEDEEGYLQHHNQLLQSRSGVDLDYLVMASSPGFVSRSVRMIRQFFWKVLRPVMDWIFFRQNAINVQIAAELEFEIKARRLHDKDMEKRLKLLEQQCADMAASIKGRHRED